MNLRRAELTAAIEADKVKAAAREAPEAPAQHAPHGGSRRKSGADTLRTQSQGILDERPPDPGPGESEGTELMVEVEEQEAKVALQTGLENAARLKENAIDAFVAYVPDADTGEEEQALAQVVHKIARADAGIADLNIVVRGGRGATAHWWSQLLTSAPRLAPSGPRRRSETTGLP